MGADAVEQVHAECVACWLVYMTQQVDLQGDC